MLCYVPGKCPEQKVLAQLGNLLHKTMMDKSARDKSCQGLKWTCPTESTELCNAVWFPLTETETNISVNGKIMNPLTATETETEISAKTKMKVKRNISKRKRKRNWNEKMQNGMKPFHFRFGARTEHVNNACTRRSVPPMAPSGPNGPATHRVPNGLRVRHLDRSPE